MRRGALSLALLAACGGSTPTPAEPAKPAQGQLTLEHDFGTIPHGESRQHEFLLDLAKLGEVYVPMRVHIDCSCGHADLRLRHVDGRERFVDVSGAVSNLPTEGESLFLRVVIDTKAREAIDLPRTQSRGFIVLQRANDLTGTQRIQWPLLVHFGIESPVQLRPLAALDFGRVPQSSQGHLVTTLRGDEHHTDATFGPASCSDPSLQVELVRAEEHWLLRATAKPAELGHHRAIVKVATSIPDYQVELAATWKVVPDLEATPLPKVSFRVHLDRPQTEQEAANQFVVLTDHDTRRSPEFKVLRCVDAAGRDLQPHFRITFVPMADQSRQTRMGVQYLGGLTEPVRGSIVLTKNGEAGPLLPIELVVFAAK